MSIFNKKSNGGLMDVIRCDEQEYLVWKWRPSGEANSTKKENAIRWGSSLRVKEGEVAVFVYKQKDGSIQEFIEGPFDEILKTANLPIIANIIGLAYSGGTPFQAEVYFINLAENNQVRFGVPYFDVFDPRFLDFAIPTAARGNITFNITDYRGFIKLQRLINFELSDFYSQINDAICRYIKGFIINIPSEIGIPALQLERKILDINDMLQPKIREILENDFGVNMKRFDLSVIEFDKESKGYAELRRVTADLQTTKLEAELQIGILDKTMQVESRNINVLQIEKQAEVLKAAAESMGTMGTMDLGGDGSGMNPAGMMTGMMMGGALGGQMAGMMNKIGQPIQQSVPPTIPQNQYNVAVDGQTYGPYDLQQLQLMIQNNQIKPDTFLWKAGMANWEVAANISEISLFFVNNVTPPSPPPKPSL